MLVPACSRPAEAGMEVQTDSERVRTSRKVVLEFLGSSVDVSLAGPAVPDGSIHDYMARYGADPSRYGPAAAPSPAGARDEHDPGHHHAPGATRRRPPSRSPRRSTTTSTCATTRSASSATSASRRAARTPRTRSRSPSRAAGSMPGSRPSRPCHSRKAPACTAGTASGCARRARSWPSPNTTCARPAHGTHRSRP